MGYPEARFRILGDWQPAEDTYVIGPIQEEGVPPTILKQENFNNTAMTWGS